MTEILETIESHRLDPEELLMWNRWPTLFTTLTLALLAWAPAAFAVDAELRRCDASLFPIVVLNMGVTDGDPGMPGDPFDPPLEADSFECFEEGELQTELFEVFPPGDDSGTRVRGADIVFAVDSSGSMADEIATVRDNITAFVRELESRGLASGERGGVGLGLVVFGASNGTPSARNNGSLTTSPDDFIALLERVIPEGGFEPGFAALREAVDAFDFQPGSQRTIILMTDEDSDGSDGSESASQQEQDDTVDKLLEAETVVYAAVNCADGDAQRHYCDDETGVAARTGGQQFNVTDDLAVIIDDIAERIGETYVVRYVSSRPDGDGTERMVECAVSVGDETDMVECTYTPNSAPKIELTIDTQVLLARPLPPGAMPEISVHVTDEAEPFVEEVTLFYRTTGAPAYMPLEMTHLTDDIYAATLPTTERPGVDFYIRASDGVETTTSKSIDPAGDPWNIAVRPNAAPFISHRPVTAAAATSTAATAAQAGVVILARVTDSTDFLESVVLRWRNFGELFFDAIDMENVGGSLYSATIPADQLRPPLEYYIEATDNHGVSSTFGSPDAPCPNCRVLRGFPIAVRPGRGSIAIR